MIVCRYAYESVWGYIGASHALDISLPICGRSLPWPSPSGRPQTTPVGCPTRKDCLRGPFQIVIRGSSHECQARVPVWKRKEGGKRLSKGQSSSLRRCGAWIKYRPNGRVGNLCGIDGRDEISP